MSWVRIKSLVRGGYERVRPWINDLGPLGILLALGIAVYHSREIEHVSSDIDRVRQSMSTRPLRAFPAFVDQIAHTVDSAQDNVEVVCDFPSYGFFDDKGTPIWQALENRIRHLGPGKVRLTFLIDDRRAEARKAQFPESHWNENIKNPGTGNAIIQFLRRNDKDPQNTKYAELLQIFKDADNNVLKGRFSGASVTFVDDDMPLLFWIADGHEAVMVAQGYGGVEESAFLTQDPQLIKALRTVSDRYRKKDIAAQPNEPH